MTGKAHAVRAVSQQFKDRTKEVIDGIMAHLNDANAKEILGPGLSPLIGRGSLKSIVTFALYADVLRMVRDMVMADGEISDEEVQESLGLLSVLAGGFAKVRSKDYSAFAQLSCENTREFLAQYESDAGLFGYANEATKSAGVELCRNVEHSFGDTAPLKNLGNALAGWAEAIAEADGKAPVKCEILESLSAVVSERLTPRGLEECKLPVARVLDASAAKAFESGEVDDLASYSAITDDAAVILIESYKELNLNGLRRLSDSIAAVLGRASADLGLAGLNQVTETSAYSLSGAKGTLDLSGLEEINEQLASILAQHSGGSLYLNGLTSLDEPCAKALSGHTGLVALDGLESISTTVIRHLARIRGLSLDGLKSLETDQAEMLAAVKGSLWLSGIASLGEQCAAALSKHRGSLVLNGVTDLSEQAARILITHHGELSLNVDGMPQNIVDILRQHPSLFDVEQSEGDEDPDVVLEVESGEDGTRSTVLCFACRELSKGLPLPPEFQQWIEKSLVQDEYNEFCQELITVDEFVEQWQEWMPCYEMPDMFVLPKKDCCLLVGGEELEFGQPYFCWTSRPRRIEYRMGRRAALSSFVWRGF